MVGVRYIADDVGAAASFYVDRLGFDVELRPEGAQFALLRRGELRLYLNAPGAGGAGQPGIDGRMPEPGGWNRFQFDVDDLDELVGDLRAAGCSFRTDIVEGAGGRQALVEDPAGNVVELFESR